MTLSRTLSSMKDPQDDERPTKNNFEKKRVKVNI